jgi:mannose-6-phosphate isomerase-like protein (cupin superfamily)
VNYIHTTLSKALKDAMSDGLIPRNVASGIKAPKPVKKEIIPLSQEQARAFLEAARGDRSRRHCPRARRRPNHREHNAESDRGENRRLDRVPRGDEPPGTGPPRHIHHSCDELFYVLEGEFLFLVGERQVSALPGTFVFIPRGTVHAAKVIGTEPGKVLAAYIPGGLERSFEEFAQLRTEQGEDANRSTGAEAGPWRR